MIISVKSVGNIESRVIEIYLLGSAVLWQKKRKENEHVGTQNHRKGENVVKNQYSKVLYLQERFESKGREYLYQRENYKELPQSLYGNQMETVPSLYLHK